MANHNDFSGRFTSWTSHSFNSESVSGEGSHSESTFMFSQTLGSRSRKQSIRVTIVDGHVTVDVDPPQSERGAATD